MRIVVQRVKRAEVQVAGETVGEIAQGYLVLVGFQHSDNQELVEKLAEKIKNLRIFSDEGGKMNLAISEVKGKILSVPQFTLYGDVTTGRRPSFTDSAPANEAEKLYEYFNSCLRNLGVEVATGVFQAEMAVELVNDGPVTLIIDSEDF